MDKKLQTTTLANGLTVATVADAHARTATAMVLVGVGSSYESAAENGLSHFLEHMCFKGTVRRPTAKALIEEIESLGATTNAFTDRECTGYHIKGNPEHLGVFVDLLADIYQHATFPEAEIGKEQGVVIEEINMYEDMPQQKVADVLFESLYPGQPAGRSILGTKQTVRSLTRAGLVAYKRRFYTPANTVLMFSGRVSHAQAVSFARAHFGKLPAGTARRKPKTTNAQQALVCRAVRKPLDQAHCILGFRSVPLGHPDLTTIRLLATILGRGMSSRLSLLLREELGAAYYVYAQQETNLDHGVFLIGAGIDRGRLPEIAAHLAAQCRRLKEEPVPDAELAKAKEYAIGTLRQGLETSDEVGLFYGIQLVLRQKVRTPEDVIADIRKVSPRDLRRVSRRLFSPSRATFALVGPFGASGLPKRALAAI